jgi:hypothetical protein
MKKFNIKESDLMIDGVGRRSEIKVKDEEKKSILEQ